MIIQKTRQRRRRPLPGVLAQKMELEEINWTPELEVALFHSLHGHKPVGKDQINAILIILT